VSDPGVLIDDGPNRDIHFSSFLPRQKRLEYSEFNRLQSGITGYNALVSIIGGELEYRNLRSAELLLR
jgi:hypothetical protein